MTVLAPMPYFGGKRKVAPIIWQHFGDVESYVEPFMGSLAVLLGRPEDHIRKAETVNDLDNYLVNLWRAIQAAPDEVARWADWIVAETDLTARHLWLVNEGRERIASLAANPDAYDAKVAGWWLWGICIWIGSGWCSGDGPWRNVDGVLSKGAGGGDGVTSKRPHLGNAGRGVNRQLSHLGGYSASRGINNQNRAQDLYAYMAALSARLRNVRVCCGDWQRVVTPGALSYGATVGIFLDPPYAASTGRNMTLYTHEMEVSAAVGAWAIANGDNPRLKIALCGYEGEYQMPDTWTCYAWTAGAAYKTARGDQNGNRRRERVWFSPTCSTMPLWEQGA